MTSKLEAYLSKGASMKQIIALIKWAWHSCSGDREYFEKRGNEWVCTRCGGVE